MIVEAVLVPLAIGKIRGGKFKNLEKVYIEKWYLLVLSALIETIASFIRMRQIEPLWQFLDKNIILIDIIIYSLIIMTIYANRNKRGFKLILIGVILNGLVIFANNGKMPVDVSSIKEMISRESLNLLNDGKDLVHTATGPNTKLEFLADILHLKKPYPFPKILSLGDIFMIGGTFLFIQDKMIIESD
ncbi:DUF5317 domain-containing protein [Anaeromicrobium sediminis]|uniref:DUF5317 domain-containing protein n=1 Tax=Anaeromicrobium sediminis TaxID=1478221 RepID=A0A267ME68_9FIRM|nr:DUF5317 domain-containing protein [Anaeromicrobium sediminis]PAB57874.1 hypothetical protein CCE28_17920 [Anaeromicrobium sediminis]